ncbi:hypothetical protein G6F57_019345 [Rhizopus arrhizus]|uniref:Uncharacterized protein n=1 Tax=Rhizopus oryzae TaxID=64495 RepID=A0A9P6WV15_RHIOR|nr:hypothetical protein G6F24_015689 [Rhizopus arrhizus]KAG0770854.1 hypothetical protein G6F22_017024 [Rhizopus arrhizus]KAG0775421.1 hypothetical protein G6F21_013920 [Rhizopus arrhizus]KAG0802902.1 hypothetical protein G6F20_014011 [Rhizopus arrhizus]KAG0806305.1 hypothetical protein G6F19_013974 [Rhizopus arrhizus]
MATTGELDVIRLETLSNKYNNTGLTSAAASLLSTHRTDTTRSTNRSYRFGQNLFIQWALQHQVSLTDFTATDLHHHRNYQLTTLKTIRSSVLHLHRQPASLRSDPLTLELIQSIAASAPPIPIHRPQVDISDVSIIHNSI